MVALGNSLPSSLKTSGHLDGVLATKPTTAHGLLGGRFQFWFKCAGGARPLLKQSEFTAIYSDLVNNDPPKMGGMSMGASRES